MNDGHNLTVFISFHVQYMEVYSPKMAYKQKIKTFKVNEWTLEWYVLQWNEFTIHSLKFVSMSCTFNFKLKL